VAARSVVEGLDVLEDLGRELARVGHERRCTSFFLSVAKNESATALS
jgi:hypothetical protein